MTRPERLSTRPLSKQCTPRAPLGSAASRLPMSPLTLTRATSSRPSLRRHPTGMECSLLLTPWEGLSPVSSRSRLKQGRDCHRSNFTSTWETFLEGLSSNFRSKGAPGMAKGRGAVLLGTRGGAGRLWLRPIRHVTYSCGFEAGLLVSCSSSQRTGPCARKLQCHISEQGAGGKGVLPSGLH